MGDSNVYAGANGFGNSDIDIKHEVSADLTTAMPSLDSTSNKRRRSGSPCPGEKRQRIEPDVPSELLQNDDFASILRGVSDHVEQQFRQQPAPGQYGSNGHSEVAAHNRGFTSDPYLSMRILSLPVLDSLSTQILSTLSRGTYIESVKIVEDQESELGQAYMVLKSLFDDTKKIYSQPDQGQFLSADDLGINEREHRATIRITNVATFAANVFTGKDIGFYELNDHFVDIFTPEDCPLSLEAGQLYLNLKSQMYLSSLAQEEQDRTKEEILEELFPPRISDTLKSRSPSRILAQSEQDFVEDCKARREYFLDQHCDAETIQTLSEKIFSWDGFLQDLSSHLKHIYEPLIDPYMKRHALTAPPSPTPGTTRHNGPDYFNAQMGVTPVSANGNSVQQGFETQHTNGYSQAQNGVANSPQQYYPAAPATPFQPSYNENGTPLPAHDAPTTRQLYERARRAAQAKSNPGTTRRPGLPSQRRPWSNEEEDMLMAGLDRVQGPHWSQILAFYGPNGTVNNVLKDRNQVQLKDKARNLKLFFLKSNIDVPPYLQAVTGDLKSRAPGQAAKKDAEARARLAAPQEQNRVDALNALVNMGDQGSASSAQAHSVSASESPSPEQFSSSDEQQFYVGGSDMPEEYQQQVPAL